MSYVSKRFRTFRKPIRKRLPRGMFLVGEKGPEYIIPLSNTISWTLGTDGRWISNAKSGTS